MKVEVIDHPEEDEVDTKEEEEIPPINKTDHGQICSPKSPNLANQPVGLKFTHLALS